MILKLSAPIQLNKGERESVIQIKVCVLLFISQIQEQVGFLRWHSGKKKKKNLPANAGDTRDMGLIPGSGQSPGVGNGNLLQYSCLENSMDRGAWQATVHGSQRVRHD